MTRSWSVGTLVVSSILLIFTYYVIILFIKNDITFNIEKIDWLWIAGSIIAATISFVISYRAGKRVSEEKKSDKR
jgi:uncharacterized membrane protein